MAGPEAKIERKVCKHALKLGVKNIKLDTSSEAGFQDRLFLIPGGRPLLIEFKREGGEPEPLQDYQLDLLKRLGYDVMWCDSFEVAMAAIKERVVAWQVSQGIV